MKKTIFYLLIITIVVIGIQACKTYDKLKMFARFPQGIPQNIDISKIQ